MIKKAQIPLSTYLLAFSQAINLVAAVMSVSIAALVGTRLASHAAYATIPYGLQFAAVMVFTYPASVFMRNYGRRAGFLVGTAPLIVSGFLGYFAISFSNFFMLCAAHIFLGTYVAFANFYRFAAVDNIDTQLKPKAISLVVSGGVIAAVIGPALAAVLRKPPGIPEYSLCYGAFVILGILTALPLLFWKEGKPVPKVSSRTDTSWITENHDQARSQSYFCAIFSAASGYLVMNLLMIQASLVMNGLELRFDAISHAVQLHVLAMFAPSFITGHLISRFGVKRVLLAGFFLLSGCAMLGLASPHYGHLLIALILLGLGWNFTYIGGSTLLSQQLDEASRHRWQGVNDFLIAVCATAGALSPSILFSTVGWRGSNFLALVIVAIGVAVCLKLSAERATTSTEH